MTALHSIAAPLLVLLLGAGCATLPTLAPEPASEPNRDRHGPPDVGRYIEGLQSEERVRELDPEGVIRALELAEDAVVVDLGVGPGVFALPLARHLVDGVVYAVDVEPRQLDVLRARLRAGGIHNVVPILASHDDPHLPPDAADWIFIVDTYHHLEDRVAYLDRLRAALSAGGRLAILEYKPGDLPVGPPAAHKIPREQRHAELQAAGYGLVEAFDLHLHHDFEVWRSTRAGW